MFNIEVTPPKLFYILVSLVITNLNFYLDTQSIFVRLTAWRIFFLQISFIAFVMLSSNPYSFIALTIFHVLLLDIDKLDLLTKCIILIDLVILSILIFYNSIANNVELIIMGLFFCRVICLIPLVLTKRFNLNKLLTHFPLVLFLFHLFLVQYPDQAHAVLFFIIMMLVSISILVSSWLAKVEEIRKMLFLLSFLPILLSWSSFVFTFFSYFLLVLVLFFFSYINVIGKTIFSRDKEWVQLIPLYLFIYLISPLPGSPLFFIFIDFLKVAPLSTTALLIQGIWFLFYTVSLHFIYETMLAESQERNTNINPVKIVIFIFAVILLSIVFVERFYIYKTLNFWIQNTSFYTFQKAIEEVGFRFFIIGIPFASIFAFIISYTLRKNDIVHMIKEYLLLRFYGTIKILNDTSIYNNIYSSILRSLFLLITFPNILYCSIYQRANFLLDILCKFSVKISRDIGNLKILGELFLILGLLFISLLLTYEGHI